MKFGIGILIGVTVFATVLIMSACSSGPRVYEAPCCGEEVCDTYESEIIESFEEPDLTRDYERDTDPLLATKCLTCGIHFTYPSYGEHIKTCCP